mgnify:CR=1 FL=1
MREFDSRHDTVFEVCTHIVTIFWSSRVPIKSELRKEIIPSDINDPHLIVRK